MNDNHRWEGGGLGVVQLFMVSRGGVRRLLFGAKSDVGAFKPRQTVTTWPQVRLIRGWAQSVSLHDEAVALA